MKQCGSVKKRDRLLRGIRVGDPKYKTGRVFPLRGEPLTHLVRELSFLSVAEEEEEEKLSLFIRERKFVVSCIYCCCCFIHHLISYIITKGKRLREIFIHSFSGKDVSAAAG